LTGAFASYGCATRSGPLRNRATSLFVIYGVRRIIDPPAQLARWTGTDRQSRVVMIGRDLPREALLDSLEVLMPWPMADPFPAQQAF
jgi:hypothetical protein